jgi:ribosomal protein S18 acetylase RimI-like enzyme
MAELRIELRADDEVWLHGRCDPPAYGRLCDPLVREGRIAHFVEVAAGDEGELDCWYGLSFGRQQVYASRRIEPVAYDGPVRVRPGEIETALMLSAVMFDHLAGPPVWSGRQPRPEDEVRADWEEFLAEPRTASFVAELDGRVVAHLVLGDEGEPGATELAVAATLPEARGRGAMRALVSAAFAWAAGRGYERCDTDWRSTNVEADRCWRALGFHPTRYRLHRLVGH